MKTLHISMFLLPILFLAACQSSMSSLSVPDPDRNLVWQAGDGGEMTWKQASRYCRDLVLDGKTEWRLPEMDELEAAYSLKSRFRPPASGSYWTASTRGALKAGYVKFDFGITGFRRKTYPGYVRCVHATE